MPYGTKPEKIRIITVFDTETQGLDIDEHNIIEIAASMIDLEEGCVVKSYSTLIHHSGGNPEDARRVNHIPETALYKPYALYADLTPFIDMIEQSDILCAHNATFDKGFIDKLWNEQELEDITKPWFCSVQDIRFPKAKFSKQLNHLAADHGISIPNDTHRAMVDVNMLCSLILKTPDIAEQLEQAFEPKDYYWADIDYKERQVAKDAGFHWNPELKKWVKGVTKEEGEKLNFVIHPLTADEVEKVKQ